MLEMGRCAICKFYARLMIDHSHATGLVRGRICNRCNTVLGLIERGLHKHGAEYFMFDSFIVEVDCSSYHSYLRTPPLQRLGMVYKK